jgi:YHS domain-containing protein
MTGLITLARRVALCTVLLGMLPGRGAVLAGPYMLHPCTGGCICIPNVQNYGYFNATWRRWPGEMRADLDFPQSIGAEVLPTPVGEKQLPPSKPKLGPGGVPLEGGVLPPEGVFPGRPGIPLLPEPPIEVPGQPPATTPTEPPVETPAEPPVETPAQPKVETPAEPPAGAPPEAPQQTPAEPAKDAAMVRPFLQNGWAALAEEPRGVPPLLGPSWLGSLPARSQGHINAPPSGGSSGTANGGPRGGLPSVGRSAQLQLPAEHPDRSVPYIGAASPRLGWQPASDGEMSRQESAPSGVAAGEPSHPEDMQVPSQTTGRMGPDVPLRMGNQEGLQSQALRANWTAALHPGFRGDMGRPINVYPSPGQPQPAMYQTPLESQATHSEYHSTGPSDGRSVGTTPPDLPGEQPTGRLPGTQPLRGAPVALDGYCPVELGENERWLPGNPRWPVLYQGRTYLFHSPTGRQRFLADPRRYVPAYSGNDPVLAVDGNRRVPGQTDYCVIYDGQLYMFANSATLARFKMNPERYTVGGR